VVVVPTRLAVAIAPANIQRSVVFLHRTVVTIGTFRVCQPHPDVLWVLPLLPASWNESQRRIRADPEPGLVDSRRDSLRQRSSVTFWFRGTGRRSTVVLVTGAAHGYRARDAVEVGRADIRWKYE